MSTNEILLEKATSGELYIPLDPFGGIGTTVNGLAVTIPFVTIGGGSGMTYANGFATVNGQNVPALTNNGGIALDPTGLTLDLTNPRLPANPASNRNSLLFSDGANWDVVGINEIRGANTQTLATTLILTNASVYAHFITPAPVTGNSVTVQLGDGVTPILAGTEFAIANVLQAYQYNPFVVNVVDPAGHLIVSLGHSNTHPQNRYAILLYSGSAWIVVNKIPLAQGLVPIPVAGSGQSTVDFTYYYGGSLVESEISVIGQFIIDNTTNTIVNISGTRKDGSGTYEITGLLAPNAYQGNDNLYYPAHNSPSGGYLSTHGVSFTATNVNHFTSGTDPVGNISYSYNLSFGIVMYGTVPGVTTFYKETSTQYTNTPAVGLTATFTPVVPPLPPA